jgi:hypothetical protein
MGISKLTCTLKGAVPPNWSLDEDAYVVVKSHQRMKIMILVIGVNNRSTSHFVSLVSTYVGTIHKGASSGSNIFGAIVGDKVHLWVFVGFIFVCVSW